MISIINKKDQCFKLYCKRRKENFPFRRLICMYKIHENAYREEPKPWYEPQKNSPNRPIASRPTTVPLNHSGTRPLIPEFDIKLLKMFDKPKSQLKM